MRYFLKFAAIVALGLGLVKPASAQAVWDLKNPVTPQVTLWGVTWAGSPVNLFVAVGSKGAILTSPNGTTWTKQTTPVAVASTELYAVTWNSTQGQLVAVGGSGTILTSSNGTSWTQQSSVPSTTPTLLGVTNRGSQYVAVGSSGTIWNSSNGTAWTAATSNPFTTSPPGLNSVAWNATTTRYAVVGDNGAVATSIDGASWTLQNSTAGSNAIYTVVSTGGIFLAMGNVGTARLSNGLGSDWSTVGTITPTPPAYISSVTFGNELVAVGANGTIFTSSGGTSWTPRTSNVTGTLNSVAWNGTSIYIAVGNNGLILSAGSGGSAWTQVSSPFVNFQAIDSGAGVRAAVGPGGAIYTSTDDITWTPRSSGTTQDLQAVAWVGTGFVAVGKGGAITVSNASGTSWTAQTFTSLGVSPDFYGVAYISPTRILAVSNQGYTISSANGGSSWSQMGGVSSLNTLYGVAAGPTSIVAVGGDNTGTGFIRLISTLTGTTWSNRPNASKVLYSVVYAGNQYIAVGDVGTIYTSPDGATWTSQKSNTTALLSSVTWTGNLAVAVGTGGTVLSSPNGIDWTQRTPIPTAQNLGGVTWTGSLITAVGDGGTVITSSPAALPTVPALVAPAPGATGIPVSPRFTWGSSSGGTTYRLQVSTTSSFSALVVDDSTLTGLSGLYGPFTLGAKYYWHVRASGPTGTSAYSATDSFTVASAGASYPTLSSPANNATDISTATSLNWIAFPGATNYALQFGTDSTFATTSINDTTITGTSKFLSLAINTTYYWRMKATATSGVTAWSPRWTFTTVPNPPAAAPVLISPAQAAVSVPLNTTISWNAVSGASSYHVQLATDSTFTSAMLLNDSGFTTSRTITGLVANGVYYWRVLAKNAGGASAWSNTRMFTTANPIVTKPVLTSPASGATGVDVLTSFTWQAVNGAVTYQIQVSTDSGFATFFLRDSSLTATTRSAGQLANNTLYYWRVSAKNPAGSGPFSDRGSFTSGAAPTTPPPAPSLLTPAQFAEGVATTTSLTWAAAATAKGYRVQVSTDAGFSTVIYSDSTLTGLTATPSGLVGSMEYFWRVYARNAIGWGAPSDVFSFKTVTVAPVAPTLDAPAAFATGLLPTSVTLSWLPVAGATSYRVQVSTSSSVSSNGAFTTLYSNDSVTTTSRALPTLADNTDYFWHVLARNSAGASVYSSTRKFTTGALPVPATPVLVAPAQFDTGVVLSGSLSWTAVSGATYYKVQLSTVSDFSTPVLNDSLLASVTSRAYTSLLPGIYYYWRVAAGNNSGLSAYAARRFTTKSSTAIRTQIALMGRTLNGDEGIRFSVPIRSKVVIRMLTTDGSRIAPDYEAVLDRGYYSRPLPAAAKGSFFLVDFQAGSYHQVLKIHP